MVSQMVGRAGALVYQSRSGPPTQPWLGPDVCDTIRRRHAEGNLTDLVLAPIGFLSDHMEVVYDLDTEAAGLCRELGIHMVRAGTVGTHPALVSMIREWIAEWMQGPAAGDVCRADCCPAPSRPAVRGAEAR